VSHRSKLIWALNKHRSTPNVNIRRDLTYFTLWAASDQTLSSDKCRLDTLFITRSDTYAKTSFLLRTNDRAERVDGFHLLYSGFFSGMPHTLKAFKLPPFWPLESTSGLCGWLKQKITLSREMNHHSVTCCIYKADTVEHVSSHCFSLSCSHLFLLLSPLQHCVRAALHG
jgi:hypothetical protein